ncbi:MAG: homocysteine biosynthesis protein [Candidatus Bathyarchaeota archaeon]|nr:homocysteine biosynthesis protein [Candidatus Bathyarchaeota archaeon]
MSGDRGAETLRSYEEINEKIRRGDVVVLTADDYARLADERGWREASREVDVVTTGTFGAMCSSGAFLNFGHTEPPMKMHRCWLNDVPAYKGLAAVDAYIGATAMSETRPFEYGGGHVIEDLVAGREVELRAEAYGTDCYPRRYLETSITIYDLNQAILVNPRNAYQRYNAATNSTDRILYTYMGTLLPYYGNVTFSGSGVLSPLYKDLYLETIGIGTRIFLGGGIGYIIGEGTQHNPSIGMSTLMVRGDLRKMNPRYLRGASFYRYGTTLYVGVGIAIPLINENVAKTAALRDEDIYTDILDYGVPSRSRPSVRRVSYAELKSGRIVINDRSVKVSPLSSMKMAMEIASILKKWIEEGIFYLSRPIELLPNDTVFKPLEVRRKEPRVSEVMRRDIPTIKADEDLRSAAKLLVDHGIDHLPVVDGYGRLVGIVTSWDIARALAYGRMKLEDIMTKRVITATDYEPIHSVVAKMERYNISGLPVVDSDNRVIGLITADDISRKFATRGAVP